MASLLAWLVWGCASSSTKTAQPKPGRGIAEYREVVNEARGSVAGVVEALETLSRSLTNSFVPRPSSTPPAFPRFDKALHELEVTSVRTRARAEAIIARGETYFEEWKEQLSGTTNRAAAQAEGERYARMREHFERVRQSSVEVRTHFRPFMSRLREVRARLDQPDRSTFEERQKGVHGLIADGKQVLQSLDSVSAALNAAESALRATLAETR